MSMLVELVMKLLYSNFEQYTAVQQQYNVTGRSTNQLRLMSMLVELVMKLLYCKQKAVQSTTVS
jgi:hypothetical protein